MKKKGMTIRGMENAVCVWGVFMIQGVSESLGQTSGLSVPHRNKTNNSHPCRKAVTCFRGIAQQYADRRGWGHWKTLMYSDPIENEEIIRQCIFDVWQFELLRNLCSVRQSMTRYAHACRWKTFWAFVVNCYMINNNPTIIKLGSVV